MTTLAELAVLYRRREHLPLKTRLAFTFGAVAALHAAAVALLLIATDVGRSRNARAASRAAYPRVARARCSDSTVTGMLAAKCRISPSI